MTWEVVCPLKGLLLDTFGEMQSCLLQGPVTENMAADCERRERVGVAGQIRQWATIDIIPTSGLSIWR